MIGSPNRKTCTVGIIFEFVMTGFWTDGYQTTPKYAISWLIGIVLIGVWMALYYIAQEEDD